MATTFKCSLIANHAVTEVLFFPNSQKLPAPPRQQYFLDIPCPGGGDGEQLAKAKAVDLQICSEKLVFS